MEAEDLERVSESFGQFHAYFAPVFGRKQWRERSRDYMQCLLVQTQRRNAENLSEVIGASARSMQRFLTEAKWDDDAVVARLQEFYAPRLEHEEGVWAVDDSGFPKKGRRSAGVANQYCGVLGDVANCQVGVFLAYVSPRGRALVDKRLYLPQGWCSDPDRCEAAGIPEARRAYKTKIELAIGMLRRAMELGHLHSEWVVADDIYGRSPLFREGVEELGLWYVVDVPEDTLIWPLRPTFEAAVRRSSKGPLPTKKRPMKEERHTLAERAAEMPEESWRKVTVAEGSQGPRTYLFACERLRENRDKLPGKVVWVVYRKNLDGSEPRYYQSNAPLETSLETLGRVGGSRWPIETEFRTNKGDVGLDEYEVRSFAGWHHHITMCLLSSAFLLDLQQEWGEKDAPDNAAAGIFGSARAVAKAALHAR